MATWYVDSNRAAINWGTAVSGGVAAVDIHRIVTDESGQRSFLFARAGTPVTSARVTLAQSEQSGDAIPAAVSLAAPRAGLGSSSIKDGSVTLPDLAPSLVGHLNGTYAAPLLPRRFGAVGDARLVKDLTFTAGSATLTSDALAAFTSADVGKTVAVSQAKGTAAGSALQAAGSIGAASISLTASVTPGVYLAGTGASAEVLYIRSVTGSGPYTASLGLSNISQTLQAAHDSGETLTRLETLVTTIASVQSATQATMATNATATATAEYPVPDPVGGVVAGNITRKVGWIGTDNAAALTALAAAVPSSGAWVHFPAGGYLTSAPINWPHRVKVTGEGGVDNLYAGGTSRILFTSPTGDGMTFPVSGNVIEDISLLSTTLYSTAPTAGTGMKFAQGSYSNINRCSVISFYDGVRFENGMYYNVTNSHIYDNVNYGLFCSTPAGSEQDHGDQGIVSSVIAMMFSKYRDGVSAFRWESGGGIRFTGNKINGKEQPVQYRAGRYTNGIDMAVADYAQTVDLMVTGNSIENCPGVGVFLHTKGPSHTGQFGNVVIVGNEIGLCGNPLHFGQGATTNGQFYNVTVSGNTFPFNASGAYFDRVSRLAVGPNTWHAITGAPVSLGANCLDVAYDLGTQSFTGDNVHLVSDNTVTAASHGPFGTMRYDIMREIPATTSTSTWVNLWRLTPPQRHGGVMELVFEGWAVGVGNVVLSMTRAVTKDTGAVTLTTLGTDYASDTGTHIEVSLDTATTSGDVYVKVRLKSGTTATDYAGRCYLRYVGPLFNLKKGA